MYLIPFMSAARVYNKSWVQYRKKHKPARVARHASRSRAPAIALRRLPPSLPFFPGGRHSCNPVVVVGGAGVGRTHSHSMPSRRCQGNSVESVLRRWWCARVVSLNMCYKKKTPPARVCSEGGVCGCERVVGWLGNDILN
jgi:hypothetical protein